MIHRKWRFRILIIGLIILAPLAWYLGLIPIATGPARAGIRHALNLKVLPSSIRINASGSESWADSIIEADLEINPEQFDSLMSNRKFEQEDMDRIGGSSMTSAYRIDSYSGFEADTTWVWSYQPPDMNQYDHGAKCTLYVNNARDRVFLRFTAD